MLTPKVVVALLDYVPNLPSKLVMMLKKIASEPDPGAEEQQKLAAEAQQAATAKDKSAAVLNMAKAMSEEMKAMTMRLESVLHRALAGIGLQHQPQPAAEDPFVSPGPASVPEVSELPPLEGQMAEAAPDPTMPPAPNGLALPGGIAANGVV
jgi:hypothetical protein